MTVAPTRMSEACPASWARSRTGSGTSGPASCAVSSASTRASAVAKRSLASLRTSWSIAAASAAGMSGRSDAIGGAGSVSCLTSSCWVEVPVNTGVPVRAKYAVSPRE